MSHPARFDRAAFAAVASVAFLLGSPSTAGAQPTALSASSVGLAGSGGADARRADAASANPALLAMPGAPRASVQLPTFDAGVALAPVGLAALSEHEGTLIPDDVRADWLSLIRETGAQTLDGSTTVRGLAVQVGRWALVGGVTIGGHASLPPEAAQLVLFGNAGRTGALEDVAVRGGTARGWAVSSVGVSHGRRLPGAPLGGALAVGATVSYLSGHRLVDASLLDADVAGSAGSVSMRATTLEWGDDLPAGASGFGVDVGAAWARERLTLGLTVRNAVNTLRFGANDAWVREREIDATTDSTRSATRSGALAGSAAFGAATRDHAADVEETARFRPAVRLAARWALSSRWDVVADAQTQSPSTRALVVGPERALAMGTDWRPFSAIALRAGAAVEQSNGDSRAVLAGGLGLRLGAFTLDAGFARRAAGDADDVRVGMGIGLVWR
jgi:hypothetical protein